MAKATDYSLTRWTALTRNVGDGNLPAGSNWIENRIRPIALGRANWLFAGSLRAGQRAAAIMSLIGSAKMNDLDPYAYLRDEVGTTTGIYDNPVDLTDQSWTVMRFAHMSR